MNKIKVLVADGNFLTRSGLKTLIDGNDDFRFLDNASNGIELDRKMEKYNVDVLIIDHTSDGFMIDDLVKISTRFPSVNILAITKEMSKNYVKRSLELGVKSYLLKDCDQMEINEAIYATAKGEQFFCGKVVSNILQAPEETPADPNGFSCDGVRISAREVEIIKLVAEGSSNKEIADKLFLSVHTITTHRKNIMSKLGVNNTAGLVLFAIKQNIISPNKYLFSSGN